jgi:hypothetical protein
VFTAVSGQKVGVVTADCLPLLMASRDGRYVCSVHAGWRGAASGIIENSLALFQRYHVDPQDLVVVSGPHIHPCCYEVTGDFYQALLAMPAGELAKRHREQLFLSHQAASEGNRRKRPRATMRGSICGLLPTPAAQRGRAGGKHGVAGELHLLHAAAAGVVSSAHAFPGAEVISVLMDHARA